MDGEERQSPRFVYCLRCLTPCVLREPTPRLSYSQVVLVPARTERGLCASCAVHWWLFSVDALRWAFSATPQLLRQQQAQTMLTPLLGKMHVELGAVDWDRMLAQWELPWPDDWALPQDRPHD